VVAGSTFSGALRARQQHWGAGRPEWGRMRSGAALLLPSRSAAGSRVVRASALIAGGTELALLSCSVRTLCCTIAPSE
jgi:hypothetical protein